MQTTLVSGKALYLELRNGPHTTQLIMTPEGFNTANKLVPMTMYRRRISKVQPRKTWKQISGHVAPECDASGKIAQYSIEQANLTSRDKLSFTDSLFNQLVMQGWQLHKQPIVVEVTHEDLDDVRLGKTPYKILARVTRCRRTLGFGEELFAS
jgi:hypothetical protein